jgi:AAA15 family ATPase/GTPase
MLTLEQFLKHSWWNYGAESITDFRKSSYYQKLFKKNHKPLLNNTTFASSCNSDDLQDMIDELKLNEQYATMNSYIHEVFDIDQIDIIKNKIMLKENGQYRYLSEYGEGTKHFIKTLIILFANPNKTIYFDEIENGIHYSNLDKLWEIILTVSKQQNTQVFATTHSKECIQSYNKVALLLEDNETNYINLSQDKNGSVVAINLDRAMLRSELVQNHEVRAW